MCMLEHTKENQVWIISSDGLGASTGISQLYLIQSLQNFFILHNLTLKYWPS